MTPKPLQQLAVFAAGLIVIGTEALAAAGIDHPLIATLCVAEIAALAVCDLTS